MKLIRTPIAAAVALTLLSVAAAQAQPSATKADAELNSVTVSGIRGALERSINQKRNADSVVEIITAEDIGKMPDKNVADSLSRVPGVNTTAGGAAGQVGENEKVSIRGTADNLTLTTLNGHSVASADWFWADIVGSGRSVSYSLLPSDMVGRITVHKSSEASIPEGGVSGTVDIESRRPLDFKQPLSFSASVGIANQSFANKNDPQMSALGSWKNEDSTFGVLVQAFSQARTLKREEFENVWKLYEDTSWGGDTNAALAAAGVDLSKPHRYAPLNGSAVFIQDRKREGGLIDLQWKPTANVQLGLNAFSSEMKAANYNVNWMQDGFAMLNKGVVPTTAHVNSAGVIDELQFTGPCVIAPSLNATPAQAAARCAAAHGNAVDLAARPDARTKTDYTNLDAKFKVTDDLSFDMKLGKTTSAGHSTDYAIEIWGPYAASGYRMNGPGQAFTMNFPSSPNFANGNNATNAALRAAGGQGSEDEVQGWANIMDTKDEENYLHLDGKLNLDGVFHTLKFGYRATDHTRSRSWIVGGKTAAGKLGSSLPTASTYTGFDAGAGGALQNFWIYTPDQIKAWGDANVQFNPKDQDWNQAFDFKETVSAAYVQGNFAAGQLSGNVGVRFVTTKDDVHQFQVDNVNGTYQTLLQSNDKFAPWDTSASFNNVLPSVNLRYDFSKELIGRVALSKTMSHPDFGKYAGLNKNDTTNTGTGANPTLAPTTSNNFEIGAEWYFAPRSLLAATLFTNALQGYVTYGESKANFYNSLTKKVETYTLGGPAATDATVRGIELSYQQAMGGGFGVDANFTYAEGKETTAIKGSLCAGDSFVGIVDCNMFGTSRQTYNLGAYYEDNNFSARVSYSKRSPYLFGTQPSRSVYVDAGGSLGVALNYNINPNVIVSIEGQNLLDPVMSTTSARTNDQVDVGRQGRTLFATLRVKY